MTKRMGKRKMMDMEEKKNMGNMMEMERNMTKTKKVKEKDGN